MSKDPAALFYIDKWLASTAEMDSDVRGWYLNLILHQFDKKDLPDDVEKLALLAGVKHSEFDRFKQVYQQVLKQKFPKNENGRLENEVAKQILKNRELYKDKRSRSGKIGSIMKIVYADKAWNKKNTELLKEHLYTLTDDEINELKDEQMLQQMLQHLLELYINGDVNEDSIIDGNKVLTWRNDFKTYLSETKNAFQEIANDTDWISKQQEFHPKVDIIASLDRAFFDYWGKEVGWRNKKSKKTVNIDWKSTLSYSIQKYPVYKQNK